jgi:hypothetical protein
MNENLQEFFENYVAEELDYSGLGELNILVESERQNGTLNDKGLVDWITVALESELNFAKRYWVTMAYIIERLEVNNTSVVNSIERAISRNYATGFASNLDEYSAWHAQYLSGGFIAPRHLLQQLKGLRSSSPPLWLDLSIIANSGSAKALTASVCNLVKETMLQVADLKSRYRKIIAALNGLSFEAFLVEVHRSSENMRFKTDLGKWASDRLGYNLSPVLEVASFPSSVLTNTPTPLIHDSISDMLREYAVPSRNFVPMIEPQRLVA